MPLGFTMVETMSGTHHFCDPSAGDPSEREFYFRITWGGSGLGYFNPKSQEFMHSPAEGVINVGGLTGGEVPCSGSLVLDYFGQHKLVYTLDFEAGGKAYRYVGEKVGVKLTRPVSLIKTHTTCYGAITEPGGRIISKSVSHFKGDQLVPFVTSFRIRLAR